MSRSSKDQEIDRILDELTRLTQRQAVGHPVSRAEYHQVQDAIDRLTHQQGRVTPQPSNTPAPAEPSAPPAPPTTGQLPPSASSPPPSTPSVAPVIIPRIPEASENIPAQVPSAPSVAPVIIPRIPEASANIPAQIKKTIEEGVINNPTTTHEYAIVRDMLNFVYGDSTEHGLWSPKGFLNGLQAISGSETESRELSLGILFLRDQDFLQSQRNRIQYIDHCPQELQEISELGKLLSDAAWNVSRLRQILIDLVPYYPGGAGRPLLVVQVKSDPLSFEVIGGRIPEAHDKNIRDTHGLYSAVTKDFPDTAATVFWLKPARSVRVYQGGQLIMQSIQLRKQQQRCYRRPGELAESILSQLKKRGMTGVLSSESLEIIIALTVEISEERVGGAIYLMEMKTYEDACLAKPLNDHFRMSRRRDVFGHKVNKADRRIALSGIPFGTLLQMVRDDGAVIINLEGQVLANGVYFDGVGGRKKTAEHVCCKPTAEQPVPVCALVISQDGEVLWTDQDKLVQWGDVIEPAEHNRIVPDPGLR